MEIEERFEDAGFGEWSEGTSQGMLAVPRRGKEARSPQREWGSANTLALA